MLSTATEGEFRLPVIRVLIPVIPEIGQDDLLIN